MAASIIDKNPNLAAELGKIFGIKRIKSIEIHARWREFSTVTVEFIPNDEQCDQILETISNYKIVPNEDGTGEESIEQADGTGRTRGPMI